MRTIETTKHFLPLFDKNNPDYFKRFHVLYGGRGGLKSWQGGRKCLIRALENKTKILCCREYQNSIGDSVIGVLKSQSALLGLDGYFDFKRDGVDCINGTEFIFAGLSKNPESIKSKEGIGYCWVEEATSVSSYSLEEILLPTITRNKGAQCLITFNTGDGSEPIHKKFITNKHPHAYVSKINYTDNPFIDAGFIEEAELMRDTDYDRYKHIYLGEVFHMSENQIFRNKYKVQEFEPNIAWGNPLFGADWGFAKDPTTLIKMFFYDDVLYIYDERYMRGCEIRDTATLFDGIEDSRRHKINADSARPELISHLRHEGFNIDGVSKTKLGADKENYVVGGINWLLSLKGIVIHPRCVHMIEEARLYSYKCDKITGEVLNIIEDDNNHCWDAVRYGAQPLIQNKAKKRHFL